MKLKTNLSESLTRKGLACKDLLPDANASGLGELFQDCLNISKKDLSKEGSNILVVKGEETKRPFQIMVYRSCGQRRRNGESRGESLYERPKTL